MTKTLLASASLSLILLFLPISPAHAAEVGIDLGGIELGGGDDDDDGPTIGIGGDDEDEGGDDDDDEEEDD